MRSVCFTGHRKITVTQELKRRLYIELEQLVKNGVTDFYVGGAIGFDYVKKKIM